MTITELKPYEDKTVILHLRDGEVATAKIALVDAEYEDVIVDIVETNRPDAYRKPIGSSAFAIRLSDLDFIEEISN
jgi:small nuclear ribonucleoprotein (snRNP)-like protein